MASEKELLDQCVPINSLRVSDSSWVIRVLVFGSGIVKEFNNKTNQGTRKIVTLVDEEGTKIHATLFNGYIELWKNYLQQNKIYYIINGRINSANPNFQSVHNELEIGFKENTLVEESNSHFSTIGFSNNFISFDEASKCTNGTIFDIVGILVDIKPSMGEGSKKRREIVLINEMVDRKTVTLWNDFSEIDGQVLQKLIDEKPVVAACDVRKTSYRGNFSISTTYVSSIMINPKFEKAVALQKWHDYKKAKNIDISLLPSIQLKNAREVKIEDIKDDSFDNKEDTYFKFNARIKDIMNKDEPWYSSCKKCYKKVDVINNIAKCHHCGVENVDYQERYILKLEVFDKKERCYVTLFESTRYLLGCDVTTYIQSISQKKEEFKFYRKLVLSREKEFTFLVKIDSKNGGDRDGRRFIAEEIQEVEKLLQLK
ncbi:replication protein A 70 kDa DNA-binding subunit B-like [Nicotiana tabacum]|uniref:Replication protein A 70 kDa DNA-binding subunit B-like n=1 Tax=Nicotiana tabacum TaxID=4097 RepID=A0A1S4BAI4_TOBAC|nr:PREDICTED: replication protein A 70 kDa DNA-binding subunit B-like [Nicotiana tabacum]